LTERARVLSAKLSRLPEMQLKSTASRHSSVRKTELRYRTTDEISQKKLSTVASNNYDIQKL